MDDTIPTWVQNVLDKTSGSIEPELTFVRLVAERVSRALNDGVDKNAQGVINPELTGYFVVELFESKAEAERVRSGDRQVVPVGTLLSANATAEIDQMLYDLGAFERAIKVVKDIPHDEHVAKCAKMELLVGLRIEIDGILGRARRNAIDDGYRDHDLVDVLGYAHQEIIKTLNRMERETDGEGVIKTETKGPIEMEIDWEGFAVKLEESIGMKKVGDDYTWSSPTILELQNMLKDHIGDPKLPGGWELETVMCSQYNGFTVRLARIVCDDHYKTVDGEGDTFAEASCNAKLQAMDYDNSLMWKDIAPANDPTDGRDNNPVGRPGR